MTSGRILRFVSARVGDSEFAGANAARAALQPLLAPLSHLRLAARVFVAASGRPGPADSSLRITSPSGGRWKRGWFAKHSNGLPLSPRSRPNADIMNFLKFLRLRG